VLVSDLAMPGGQYGDGMPLLGYIGRQFPTVRIALDSMGLSASGQQRDVVLSKRELEAVRLFVSGTTITEIAAQRNAALKPSVRRKIL
jgi:two-component system capsular synthesis response regulator RcsB